MITPVMQIRAGKDAEKNTNNNTNNNMQPTVLQPLPECYHRARSHLDQIQLRQR